MDGKRLRNRESGRVEGAEVVEEDRYVDVHAPLARAGIGFPGRDRVLDVQVVGDRPAVAALERLRQVDRLRVAAKLVHRLVVDRRDVQGRGFLQLQDRNAGVDELLEGRSHVLVLDGLVADVEDDPDVTAQRDERLRDRDPRELREP